jgi:hypothetical protein
MSVIGKGKESWKDGESWKRLKDRLEELEGGIRRDQLRNFCTS